MAELSDWRSALGLLSVAMAIGAAAIYVAQTLRGAVRPHPLSWFLFGVLSGTGAWVQFDAGARAGSWALAAMTAICFLFVAASLARGERSFSRAEWAFAAASLATFALYFATRNANAAAALVTLIDALAFGPTFVRGWRPARPSCAAGGGRRPTARRPSPSTAQNTSRRSWLWTRSTSPPPSIRRRSSS